MNVPKMEEADFGSNCRLSDCFLHLVFFWFYVYFSLVFSAYYHWWICLLVGLLTSFFIYTFFPFFSFCECVCVCFLVRFCLHRFAFTICPMVLSVRFYVFVFFLFFSFLSLPFLLSGVPGSILMLWLAVRPETLRCEGRVQDIGPSENS